jgi:hypothetical protein
MPINMVESLVPGFDTSVFQGNHLATKSAPESRLVVAAHVADNRMGFCRLFVEVMFVLEMRDHVSIIPENVLASVKVIVWFWLLALPQSNLEVLRILMTFPVILKLVSHNIQT